MANAAKDEPLVQVKVKGTHYPSGSGAPFPPGSILPMKREHAEQLIEAGHAELAEDEE